MELTLKHKKPCKECPWKRNSAAGYLGGNITEDYCDAQKVASPIQCHMARGCYCIGALISLNNSSAVPRDKSHAEAADEVGKSRLVFGHWTGFRLHHDAASETPLTPEEKDKFEKFASFYDK